MLPPAGIAVVLFLFHALYFDKGIRNLVDLGVAAVDAERVLFGQTFAHDFLAPYGPGRYYLAAGAFKLFHPSMGVLLGLFLLLRVGMELCFWSAARKVLSPLPALLALACVAAAHGPSHKVYLALGLSVLLLASFRWLEAPRAGRAFVLGLTAGGAGLFRYDLGAAGLLVGAALMAAHPPPHGPETKPSLFRLRTRWIPFLVGTLLAGAPAVILILSSDEPSFLVHAERMRAALLAHALSPEPGPLSSALWNSRPATGILSFLLLAAPWILLCALVVRRIRTGKARGTETRPLHTVSMGLTASALGFLFFSQYLIEPKINRLLQVAPPLFLCLFLLAELATRPWRASPALRRLPSLLLAGIVGVYVFSDSGGGSIDSVAVLFRPQVKVKGSRAGFYCNPALASNLEGTLAWLEARLKKGTFYASPSLPLLYFLAGKKNPAPVTDFSYLLRDEAVQERVLHALEKEEVRCWIFRSEAIQGFLPEREAPLFYARLALLFPREEALPTGYRVRWKR